MNLGSSFGVMQGRLSEQGSRFQACPIWAWENEFELAHAFGFNHIEWVIDSDSLELNPLLTDPERVKSISQSTNVKIPAATADFLRDRPLSISNTSEWQRCANLLRNMGHVGVEICTVPFVETASLRDKENRMRALSSLGELVCVAREHNVIISIESDLPPLSVTNFLDQFLGKRPGVTFDSGDSAALGFDARVETSTLRDDIVLVHLKDRPLGGNSVPLGEGATDFQSVLYFVANRNFTGPVTLQAFRDREGLGVLKSQVRWLQKMLEELGLARD